MSIDVMMPGAKDSVLIGARANPNCCGRVITGEVRRGRVLECLGRGLV